MKCSSRITLFFLTCTLSAPTVSSVAQAPLRLPAPDATLTTPFTRVTAIRELADGRVLIVDEGEQKVVVADLQSGSTRQVGDNGSAPGQYLAVQRLFAIGADSSILPDPGNGRWLLLESDALVGMLGASEPLLRTIGLAPLGADANGAMISTRPRIVNGTPRLDSLIVVRGSRRHRGVDTVATLMNRRPNLPSGRIDPTQAVAISFNPFAVGEQVALASDGWLAIARLRPYRVEWITPDGRRVVGGQLPFESVRVDEREKAVALQREARLSARPARLPDAVGEWPDVVPPFPGNALLLSTDGLLWIRRTPTAANPNTLYDVIDRRGELVRRVLVAESERVVGFGRGTIYTVREDADGLQTLRRHRQ